MVMDVKENKKPDWHSGYIVTLNTLARFFDDTRDDIEKYCDAVQSLAEKGVKGNDEYSQHPHTYMTFGDFDRITFNNVDRFSRFFDLDKRSKYWLGKHQNVYLYQIYSNTLGEDNPGPRLYPYKNSENIHTDKPYNNDFGFCINYDPDKWYLFSSNYGNDAEYNNSEITDKTAIFPFLILTQISLSNDVLFRIADMGEFLIQLREKLISQLDPIIEKHCSAIKYEIYGCLNTSELCILWIAEQYTDVLSLLDELKKMKFDINETKGPLFFTVYSIIGRLLSNSTSVDKSVIEKCNGTAQVDIIVNNRCSGYELLDTLEKQNKLKHTHKENYCIDEYLLREVIKNSYKRVGEHDISLRVPASIAYDLFNEGDSSNAKGLLKQTAIRGKILGTRVALLHDNLHRFEMLQKEPLKFHPSIVGDKLIVEQFTKLHEELDPSLDKDSGDDKIRSLYKKIRDYLINNFSSHTGSVDTLDMLYTDYLSNIHESYNAIWRNDYNYQFKNSLVLLKTQLKSIADYKDKAENSTDTDEKQDAKLNRDNEVIKFWKLYPQIIDNIRQQTSHFSQSGRLVMRIPSSHLRYTACCDLMFHGYYGMVKAILFDAYSRQNINSFQSELLPVITTNSNTDIRSKLFFVGPNCYDLRLLHIDIPYSLLYDPVTGFPYMIHEMFHYIVPSSRDNRNRAIGAMVINEVLTFQYTRQFYECLKLYDHAKSDKAFEEKIKHYKEKNFDDKVICHNASSELAISLKNVLWHDETLFKIRKDIIDDVIDKTIKDPTWTNFLRCLEDELSQLPLSVYELISERLLLNMYQSEQVAGKSKTQIFINCSDSLNEGLPKGCERKISHYEKLVYEHKLTMLNPNSIYRANVKSTLFSGIRDTFITGLREASPDMAMVMYCNMDEVSYLVSCARQIDSSISKMTASYEVVRIPIVLAWIYCRKNGFNNDVFFELKKLLSQPEIRSDFIIEYMVEYLPQEPTTEKLVKLITDAIVWYWRFKNLAYAFTIEYPMYTDMIVAYGKCYRMYDAETNDRKYTVQQLINTTIDRREKKKIDRKKLLHDDLWDKIISISEDCNKDKELINEATPPEYDKIHNYVKKEFPISFDIDAYTSNNKEYNRSSFNTSLKFVHQAARQISLEDLQNEVKTSSGDPRNGDQKGNGEKLTGNGEIINQIDSFTVRRAWGMTEFSDILQTIRAIIVEHNHSARLWYLAKSEKECLLPSAYEKKDNSPIIDYVTAEEIRSFKQELYGTNSTNTFIRELVTQEMAVENYKLKSNKWVSNMIVWHNDVITSLKQLCTEESNLCLYLFSPVTYLKAREFILNNLGLKDIPSLHFTDVLPIDRNEKDHKDNAHSYFLKNAGTRTIAADEQIPKDRTTPGNEHLKYVMPVPYIIEDGSYLAYNLILSSRKGKYDGQNTVPECALYTLDQIQTMMLRLIKDKFDDANFIKKYVRNGGDGDFEISKWAFFYTIKIDRDIVNGINDLSKTDLSKDTTQR